MSLSPKWRHFLQNAQWQINTSLILALLNLFTFLTSGDTSPWFLIPVFFLSLSLVPELIDTLFSQDKPKKRKGKRTGKTKSHPLVTPPPKGHPPHKSSKLSSLLLSKLTWLKLKLTKPKLRLSASPPPIKAFINSCNRCRFD